MPIYTPIEVKLPIRQGSCDLVDVSWTQAGLAALFSISKLNDPEPKAVRVSFGRIVVMRIVDEMTYSLEERGKDVGIKREGFAYEVADSLFRKTLTDAPNTVFKNPKQYTFMSQNSCLEVIASKPPVFELIDLRPWLRSMGIT